MTREKRDEKRATAPPPTSPPAAPPGRWSRIAPGVAVAVVALATVLAVATPQPHSGGDNAGYLSLAHALVTGEGYVESWDPDGPPHTKYPPVFPIVLAGLVAAGATTWTAFKLVPALAIVAGTVLAFAWTARRLGPASAVAIALLSLFSLGWLDASRWILSEPVFLAWIFLALWASERGVAPVRLPGTPRSARSGEGSATRWLVLAAVATGLACFTRAAAAPLAVALLGVLALRRRWGPLAAVGTGLAIPATWWVLRARRGGGAGAYQSEFWMVDPYEPGLGTVGWLDLPVRAWRNLWTYVVDVLPAEWWPSLGGAAAGLVGVVLVGLASAGWVLRIRDRGAGVAELFGPLYLGLILVWPEVWSGNRFLLPLHPILLAYSAQALGTATRPLGRNASRALSAAALLLVALPTLPRAIALSAEARACRAAVETYRDVFACHPASFEEFRAAAAWSGANLPADAVVLNRKPRMLYALGGPPGRVFPFSQDPAVLLAEADRSRARYLLLDHMDGISLFYLPAVIQASPNAFCVIVSWGGGAEMPGTVLLGILPEEARSAAPVESLGGCPASYVSGSGGEPEREGVRIPLLVRE